MRIKSYFAPSVQSAIAMARREFGDEVTLVTSHLAAPDARHMGEYEVVFAVDGDEESEALAEESAIEAIEESVVETTAKFTAFQEVLLNAVTKKPPTRSVLEQIDSVRSTLIELGVEASMVRALMTLVERSIDAAVLPEAHEETGAMLSQLADSLTSTPEITIENVGTAVEQAFGPMIPSNFESTPAEAEPPEELAAFAVAACGNTSATIATQFTNRIHATRLTAAELAFVMSVSEVSDAVRR